MTDRPVRNFILVGAGGTGSFLFLPLVRYLRTHTAETEEPHRITVIDGKNITDDKLYRQMFFGKAVGNNKAQALIEQYGADPEVVVAMGEYLNNNNIAGVGENDVILIAADNFPVRARIERHGLTLQNITVINGGNEMRDGSLQVWIRRNGENITPPMSQGHPEIYALDNDDPASLSCEAIAALPGGQQTLAANFQSAATMLNGLNHVLEWEKSLARSEERVFPMPTEVFWDLETVSMRRTERPPA